MSKIELTQTIKIYFNWSSGKDSALALYHLLKGKRYSVEELITTVNTHYNRVSMHGL
jgi:diphthamide synthase (EF-2-diphthine--ammonia ligase)